MEQRTLTAEVFIDTGKDFRPEDSLQAEYIWVPGEIQTLEFDLSVFENTRGFRFDPLLEDSSMVKLLELVLTYEGASKRPLSRVGSRQTVMWILNRFLCIFIKTLNFLWMRPSA